MIDKPIEEKGSVAGKLESTPAFTVACMHEGMEEKFKQIGIKLATQ